MGFPCMIKTITLLIIVTINSAKIEVRPMIGAIVGREGEKKREGDQTGQQRRSKA